MLCCSTKCKKFDTCGHAYINNPNRHDNLEPFDIFGHGSYSYNSETEQIERKSWTMCDNYNMWYPSTYHPKKQKEEEEKVHQITIDELMEQVNGIL